MEQPKRRTEDVTLQVTFEHCEK